MNYYGMIKEVIKPKIKGFRESIYLLRKNVLTSIALYVILALVLIAIFAPYIVPYPEDISNKADIVNKFMSPSGKHFFGTDELGRDIFSRVLYGPRISLTSAIITVGLALLIGIPLGAIAGFMGGAIDELIMRITDMFLSFPPILLAIVMVSLIGASLNSAILSIAVSWWPWYTRLVRGQTVSLKEKMFIQAAKAIGTPNYKIILKHVIPNTISPVIVQASIDMGLVVLTLASLSFLGLGAQAPMPEWGLMISISRKYFPDIWWYSIFPGLAVFFTVLVFNMIGDGLREILDPKTRKQ